jgi:hypothetical protein
MRNWQVAVLVLAGLTACTTVPQAGLVYSSRIVGGLDISSNATQTQGLSVNIGFKTEDFAYVPVAVAASGVPSAPGPLYAEHSEAIEDAVKRLPPDERVRVEAALAADRTRASALHRRDSIRGQLRRAEAEEKKGLTPQRPIADLKTEVARADQQLTQAEEALKSAQEAAAGELPKLGIKLRDAMSVFGQFNGNSTGEVGKESLKGGLRMGRVFSTGVAAQRLGEAAKLEAAQGCLAVVERLLPAAPASATAAERQAFLNGLVELSKQCGQDKGATP